MLAVCLVTGTAAAGTSPYVPTSPEVVLERVPTVSDPRVRHFNTLRRQLNRAPHDMQRALDLANAYLDYARSTGDARYLGRSMAVIEPWMSKTPIPVPIMLIHATILQSRHFFQESRTELGAVLAREPRNAQAWLTLAAVEMVQADYGAANAACVHLAATAGDLLGILCTSELRSLNGRAQQARALLALIEDPGDAAPPAIKSYIEGVIADNAVRLSRNAEAEQHFKAALQWTPGDNFLLADYADFLLDQQRPRDVQALLAAYTQSDTSFLRLVFAEVALNDPRAAQDIVAMRARFAAMAARGSEVYQREHAMFVLHIEHDPARALQIAEQNWSVQRSPQDMRIYLEAALAEDQPQAAAPVMAVLERSHLQEPAIDALTAKLSAAARRQPEVAMREQRP
jgi:hypothetical protein